MGTDRDWQELGDRDPFWAVLTNPQFRAERMDSEARATFFASGRHDIAHFHDLLQRHAGAPPRFQRALDFGCGVGRLLIPLSELAERAAGVDVAASMRALCKQHLIEFGRDNASIHGAIAEAAAAEGPFDWINSLIVLQHIPPQRGYGLIAELAAALAPGGWLSLHVTSFDMGRPSLPPSWRALAGRFLQGRPLTHLVQMFQYDLDRVLHILWQAGVRDVWLSATDHGGARGHVVCGRRQ